MLKCLPEKTYFIVVDGSEDETKMKRRCTGKMKTILKIAFKRYCPRIVVVFGWRVFLWFLVVVVIVVGVLVVVIVVGFSCFCLSSAHFRRCAMLFGRA